MFGTKTTQKIFHLVRCSTSYRGIVRSQIMALDRGCLYLTPSLGGELQRNLATKKLQASLYCVWCTKRFDTLNRSGMHHQCDRQTDRQT